MRNPSRLSCSSAARWLVLYCLFVALPLHGLSATLAELLGPSHFHQADAAAAAPAGPTPATDSLASWKDFRRIDAVGGLAARPHAHPHDHAPLDRHPHAHGDASVVAVGAGGLDDGPADGVVPSGPAFVFVVDGAPATAPSSPPVTSAGWRLPQDARFSSCDLRRLERPPRG